MKAKETSTKIQRLSMELQTQSLQVSILSSSIPQNKIKKKTIQSPIAFKVKPITLKEDIIIPNWDKSNLTEEQIKILSEIFSWKAKQDELTR